MIHNNLAASGNSTFAHTASAGQFVEFKWGWIRTMLQVIAKIDRRAQRFFNAQASTRGRQPAKTEWGTRLEDGFL